MPPWPPRAHHVPPVGGQAEVAYAAIEAAEKLMFMAHVKELPTPEAREAELLLFRRKRAEAVQALHAALELTQSLVAR